MAWIEAGMPALKKHNKNEHMMATSTYRMISQKTVRGLLLKTQKTCVVRDFMSEHVRVPTRGHVLVHKILHICSCIRIEVVFG